MAGAPYLLSYARTMLSIMSISVTFHYRLQIAMTRTWSKPASVRSPRSLTKTRLYISQTSGKSPSFTLRPLFSLSLSRQYFRLFPVPDRSTHSPRASLTRSRGSEIVELAMSSILAVYALLVVDRKCQKAKSTSNHAAPAVRRRHPELAEVAKRSRRDVDAGRLRQAEIFPAHFTLVPIS